MAAAAQNQDILMTPKLYLIFVKHFQIQKKNNNFIQHYHLLEREIETEKKRDWRKTHTHTQSRESE
jgi:hypothetical protein